MLTAVRWLLVRGDALGSALLGLGLGPARVSKGGEGRNRMRGMGRDGMGCAAPPTSPTHISTVGALRKSNAVCGSEWKVWGFWRDLFWVCFALLFFFFFPWDVEAAQVLER